jgi:hypothetical protein
MSKKSKIVSKLKRALKTRSVFRVSRRQISTFETYGFIIGLSDTWILMARTLEGGYSDGLIALRVRDISKVEKDTSFETRFALTQPQRDAHEIATIELDDVGSILATMGKLSPLVAIEREEVAPGACWIGRYEGERRKKFGLLLVQPDASWDLYSTGYRFKDVTTVAIDSHYNTALVSVAGEAPAGAK